MGYYTSVIVLVLLALVVLCVLISENNRIPAKKKRLFFATNILIAVSAIAECSGIHIAGNPDIPGWVLTAVKAADYTLTPLTGGALIALIQKPNAKTVAIRLLFIGNTVFQLVSAFTGWMVVVDEYNHYTHGPLYPVYMVLYLAVLVILAVELVIYGKSFRKQNRVSLYAIMILIFVGIGMQEILGSEHRVAYLALTLGAAYLYIHFSEFSQIQMDDQITEQRVKISNDALTGVLSRFAYIDAISAYSESIPSDLTVFLIDINGLKEVNDTLGHEAGDELICGAANCITASVGKKDRIFRIGGDEFVVFANMTKERADAALASLARTTQAWSGSKVRQLSISAGYALASDFADCSLEDLTKEADLEMYEQKRAYYQQSGKYRRKHPPVMRNAKYPKEPQA